MLSSIFRVQNGVSILHRTFGIYRQDRTALQSRGKYLEHYWYLTNPVRWLWQSRVKPCNCNQKACRTVSASRIKTACKAICPNWSEPIFGTFLFIVVKQLSRQFVRTKVNLFLEHSLIIVVKQHSRQFVRTKVNLFLEHSFIIVVKQLSRQFVRTKVNLFLEHSLIIVVKQHSRQFVRTEVNLFLEHSLIIVVNGS
jgi:hypothetical protein